jgi:hypothetical protein
MLNFLLLNFTYIKISLSYYFKKLTFSSMDILSNLFFYIGLFICIIELILDF